MTQKSNPRRSGVLLPVSSLPSPYGIGSFSKEAYEFVDFLEKAGQKLWQILPLGPTGYGDSPYQSFSTFAGNPYFIDLQALIAQELLTKKECKDVYGKKNIDTAYVDYEKLYQTRYKLLALAYDRATEKGLLRKAAYKSFVKENSSWLKDYALYMAVKDSQEGKCWVEWPEEIRLRKTAAVKEYQKKFEKEMGFYMFQQYLFFTQWKALKSYANEKGIEIVGDIPIYVAFDSADTWANPQLFQLDEQNMPIGVAGCPPDAFCETGQLWGNPLYRWEYHKQTGYEWWMNRISYCYQLYDVLRIDHFRGFDSYWFVPYGDETAQYGHWVKGPGYDFFKTMKQKLGPKQVIAEDLGFLTDSVINMVKRTGYPGMKILQFAFGDEPENAYLPHNYEKNCVVYTGTHDNETITGWYLGCDEKTRKYAKEYLQIKGKKKIAQTFIRAALSSVADTAIIPMQDYLSLGNEGRINTPSTLGDNWKWRMAEDACTEELAEKMYEMTKRYGRL